MIAKRMIVSAIASTPPLKFDTDLEGRLSSLNKIMLSNTQHVIEHANVGNSCFTDTHSANSIRLDERNLCC